MNEVAELDTGPQDEGQKVEEWRVKKLTDAGYSRLHAVKIAARHSGPDAIDLHKAIGLIVNGADPHVAADILL